MRKLLIVLLSALSLTAFAQQKKVAVYVVGSEDGINKVLGSKLSIALGRHGYSVTERTSDFLSVIAKEQSYQRTGTVDDEEISRIGKQFGAQLVCVVTIKKIFNLPYVSARLIDVETAEVEGAASFSGQLTSAQEVIAAGDQLTTDIIKSMSSEKGLAWKKVAVYITESEASKKISHIVGDKLVSSFTNAGRYITIERTDQFLSQLGSEHAYQRTGAVDDKTISHLGKQFGVDYVCVVDITDVLGEKYISARMIDVETAEIINMFEKSSEMQNVDDITNITNAIASILSKGNYKEQRYEDATLWTTDILYPSMIKQIPSTEIPKWILNIPSKSYVGVSMPGGDDMDAIGMALFQKILANDEPLWHKAGAKKENFDGGRQGIYNSLQDSAEISFDATISYNIQELSKLSNYETICRISDGHRNRLHIKITYKTENGRESLATKKEKISKGMSYKTLNLEFSDRQYSFIIHEVYRNDTCRYTCQYEREFNRHSNQFINDVFIMKKKEEGTTPIYIFPTVKTDIAEQCQHRYVFSQQRCLAEQLWEYYLDLFLKTLPENHFYGSIVRKGTPIVCQEYNNGEFIIYCKE
ncbi:MAG: hypothetical protein IJ814_07790 [Paludibacteraceae bacterium]|nr:hypothetical protein [Paludibacteraceae bacterium]